MKHNQVEFYNETKKEIPFFDELKKILEDAMKVEHLRKTSFNVIFVDRKKIHQLNKEYRHIDHETDVITFALEDESSVRLPKGIRVLGDIYICVPKAVEQAKEYGHSFERELSFLAVHGFYHLLGYDHQTKEEEEIMFSKQEAILSKNGIEK